MVYSSIVCGAAGKGGHPGPHDLHLHDLSGRVALALAFALVYLGVLALHYII